jgi:general secretion pathway protein M
MKPDRQLLLGAALAVALLVAVIQWIVLPVARYRESLGRSIVQAQQDLSLVAAQGQEYAELAANASRNGRPANAGKGKPEQTLFALLENLATQRQLRANIEYIRPSVRQGADGSRHDVVEMRLNGVGLNQLVPYLEAVQATGRGIGVERMNMRSHEKRPLDVDLVFSAPRKTPETKTP